MAKIYYEYFDLPYRYERIALYAISNILCLVLLIKILKDLKKRKKLFTVDTHQFFSILITLFISAILFNVVSLIILEFLLELFYLVTVFSIFNSTYNVLIFFKRWRYQIKYRYVNQDY